MAHKARTRAEHHAKARKVMKAAGYDDGGIIIPTAEQSASKARYPNADARGDTLRKVKGKSPIPNAINDANWNELVEGQAQKLDKQPYRIGSGEKP